MQARGPVACRPPSPAAQCRAMPANQSQWLPVHDPPGLGAGCRCTIHCVKKFTVNNRHWRWHYLVVLYSRRKQLWLWTLSTFCTAEWLDCTRPIRARLNTRWGTASFTTTAARESTAMRSRCLSGSTETNWWEQWARQALCSSHDFTVVGVMSHSVAPTPWGTGARVPTFTNGWALGAPWVEEQRTRNWPNCTDHHESAH